MKKAFTLIELLVVIAIIAILAAMLMPALAKAQMEARKAACSANLHNLGLQWALYLDDFNGRYPGDPLAGADLVNNNHATCLGALMTSGYVDTNEGFKCPAQKSPVTIGSITVTSTTHATVTGGDYAMDVSIPQSGDPARATMADLGVMIHTKGANILFVDSHVRWGVANKGTGETSYVVNPDLSIDDTNIYMSGTPNGQPVPAPGNGVDPVATKNTVDAYISTLR